MRMLLIMLTAALLGACTPVININVLPTEGRLKAQPVLADKDAGSDRIVMIDLRGLLVDSKVPGLILDGPNPVDRFVAQMRLAEDDASIKAVVLRITSPGGTVTASDIIHQEIRRFEQESRKPVVASIGEVGASGGYYVALAADRIMAEPTSITGSIGVIMPTMNFSEGLAKIGVVSRSVKSGANKDLANPLEPMREGQYAVLQTMVDDMYARFKGLVVQRRAALKPEDVAEATDGRIVMGERAKTLGLVDELGGVREAFARAKEMAGVKSATLVKFADPGQPPRSAYSQSEVAPPRSQEINLVQISLGSGLPGSYETSGVYYLWVP